MIGVKGKRAKPTSHEGDTVAAPLQVPWMAPVVSRTIREIRSEELQEQDAVTANKSSSARKLDYNS